MSPVTLKERTVTVLMLTTCRVGDAMAEIGMGKKKGSGHSTQEEERCRQPGRQTAPKFKTFVKNRL